MLLLLFLQLQGGADKFLAVKKKPTKDENGLISLYDAAMYLMEQVSRCKDVCVRVYVCIGMPMFISVQDESLKLFSLP